MKIFIETLSDSLHYMDCFKGIGFHLSTNIIKLYYLIMKNDEYYDIYYETKRNIKKTRISNNNKLNKYQISLNEIKNNNYDFVIQVELTKNWTIKMKGYILFYYNNKIKYKQINKKIIKKCKYNIRGCIYPHVTNYINKIFNKYLFIMDSNINERVTYLIKCKSINFKNFLIKINC